VSDVRMTSILSCLCNDPASTYALSLRHFAHRDTVKCFSGYRMIRF